MKLLHYIRGIRNGKEINRLEKKAMTDPFLADALDGFDKVLNIDHESRINEMRSMILSRTKSGNRRIFRYLSVAACILLIVGSGWYFLFNNKDDSPVYEQQTAESRKSVSNDMSQELPLLETDTVMIDEKEFDAEKLNKPAMKTPIRNDRKYEAKQTDSIIIPDTSIIENEILAEVQAKDETVSLNAVEEVVRNIEGIVRDIEGNPLPGASIIYRDNNVGTVSDENGYFKLPEFQEKNIQVNLIGYKQVNIVADTSRNIVIMKEDDVALDEVIMVAFGTRKRSSVIDAVPEEKDETPKPVIGEKEYKKYLKANAIMPQGDDCKKKKGKVTLVFTINSKGRPTNIRIKKSLCPTANREAIRLIEQGSDWTLGDKEVEINVRFKMK
jgi:TonB family protein